MNIRPVKSSELGNLLSMTRQTFIDTYEHLNDPVDFQAYLKKNFTLEKLKSELITVENNTDVTVNEAWQETNKSNSVISNYYFVETDQLIGYFKINCHKSPLESDAPVIYPSEVDFKTLKGVEIERIYVVKGMKGHGIGRLMIEKTIEIAKINGFDYVWLGVWADNAAAIAFYQKMGFTVFGEHIFMMGNDAQKDFLMMIEILRY